MEIQRIGVTPRYADAVIHGGVVHAVEVPPSAAGDITQQSSALLATLEATLNNAGSSKERLLTATIYLTDMADYDGFNTVWDAWLPAGCAPSRACVKVAGLARAGWRVEVVVSAAAG